MLAHRALALASLIAGIFVALSGLATAADRTNLLVITTDDMSCDSVGAYGCKLKGTTPNMDRLAEHSLRFNQAFVQVGNCMPSRNVLFSGLYPHNNRVEGFYQVRDPGYPVLVDLMKRAGYWTAIRHKVSHSTPYSPYPAWDVVLDELPDGTRAHARNVASYGDSMRRVLTESKAAGKPFFANINIADPHKPFYAEGGQADPNVPSRIFTADEVPIPGFLFDDPKVRVELAEYYSSVRRADDCLGRILAELDAAGQTQRTMIVFLSDHGMPLPFAKTQLYWHSTRTPFMVCLLGVTRAGSIDDEHLISAVDLVPTLCEVLKLERPERLDGRSFAPLLKGEKQSGRDFVVTEYNENAGGNRHPMRSIVTRDFAYIFSPWSNGERKMATATKGTVTYRRMKALAPANPQIAARLDLFEHRVPEELYDYSRDSDALANLIDDPKFQAQRQRLTEALESWMIKTGDPMLATFRRRDDPQAREAYMAVAEQEAKDRAVSGRNASRRAKGSQRGDDDEGTAKANARKTGKKNSAVAPGHLINVEVPKSCSPGKTLVVTIHHTLGAGLGKQTLTVTLKNSDHQRLERKTVQAEGAGVAEVTFDVPATAGDSVSIAAFVGDDYKKNLEHVSTKPIPLRSLP